MILAKLVIRVAMEDRVEFDETKFRAKLSDALFDELDVEVVRHGTFEVRDEKYDDVGWDLNESPEDEDAKLAAWHDRAYKLLEDWEEEDERNHRRSQV